MAATVAVEEPDRAPKNRLARMATMARPPGRADDGVGKVGQALGYAAVSHQAAGDHEEGNGHHGEHVAVAEEALNDNVGFNIRKEVDRRGGRRRKRQCDRHIQEDQDKKDNKQSSSYHYTSISSLSAFSLPVMAR